jgi:hypothetical protein
MIPRAMAGASPMIVEAAARSLTLLMLNEVLQPRVVRPASRRKPARDA